MATDIDMASNALMLLGEAPISALSESTAANNLYQSTYDYVLSEHPWSFALKEQYASRLTQTPATETGYTYAFQVPVDSIRLWAVMPVIDYRIVGEVIYARSDTLLCRYCYSVEESRLPAHMVKTIEYKLAADMAISVTEDEQKAQIFNQMYRDSLNMSMAKDSQQHPFEVLQRNTIRRARNRR